ncbi:hypothetical protein HDU98_004627 [Podochytrium sp. JEL0797]|nr:hypothetical protein HDU98_004627 [Podochytrium sp. JEL0797]
MLAGISTQTLTAAPQVAALITRTFSVAPQTLARLSRTYSTGPAQQQPRLTATYSTFTRFECDNIHKEFIDELRSNYHTKIVEHAAARGALEAAIEHIVGREATAEAAAARRASLL